jgi:hypothetical protein
VEVVSVEDAVAEAVSLIAAASDDRTDEAIE